MEKVYKLLDWSHNVDATIGLAFFVSFWIQGQLGIVWNSLPATTILVFFLVIGPMRTIILLLLRKKLTGIGILANLRRPSIRERKAR